MRKLLALTVVVSVIGGGVGTNTAQARKFYTKDFITATVIVGKYYGRNVRNWLQNCSSSEGGHGYWVWRSHTLPIRYASGRLEDKPGGWMQFFKSTFDNNVGWAFEDARRRGLNVHSRARSYFEPLGQAIVAGAMYAHRGNPGTWTGANC